LWVFPEVRSFSPQEGIALVGGSRPELRRFLGADRTGPTPDTRLLVSVDQMGEQEIQHLESGGRLLLLSDTALPHYQLPDDDLFRTVPWNRGSTGNCGTVIALHPALGDWPREGFCDYSFVELILGGSAEERTWPLDLDVWRRAAPLRPIIRQIDHYRGARHKALLFEAAVGAGRLIATCLRLRWGVEHNRPEARYLLRTMVEYALSEAFVPAVRVSAGQLRRVLSR
jgi:hypothetical protein